MSLYPRQSRPVAIVGSLRIPFSRMNTAYADRSLLDMLTAVLQPMIERYGLKGERLGEVALGTTFYHPEYWNLSREAVLRSGLDHSTPALGIQRACGTSLEASIAIANKIALGQIEAGIAGGVESMSNTALFLQADLARRIIRSSKAKTLSDRLKIWKGLRLSHLVPKAPPGVEPSTGMSMGEHTEIMAKAWGISREAQDELALASHHHAAEAYERGFFDDLVHPYWGVDRDNNIRSDTTMEKLAQLKPAFDRSGTLTAGNSSPLTDGAATVLLSSEEWAKERGLPILAYLKDVETAAVDFQGGEGLLMAPAYAVPRLLKRQNMKLQDFDFYEMHEAFAAQVLCTLKAWESDEFCRNRLGLDSALGSIDRKRLNVVGSSIAVGHPFGATGARIVGTLAKLLAERGSGRGLISICTGGGMGMVALVER